MDAYFETGPVFHAEKHNTGRHLNEYISLDFEMRFINRMTDIMDTETALLRYIMNFSAPNPGFKGTGEHMEAYGAMEAGACEMCCKSRLGPAAQSCNLTKDLQRVKF